MAISPEKIAEMRKYWEELSAEIEALPGYAEAAAKFDREYAVAVELNKARERAKLSQKELAKRLNKSPEEVVESNPDLEFPIREGQRVIIYRKKAL